MGRITRSMSEKKKTRLNSNSNHDFNIPSDEDIADDTPVENNEYVVNINKNVPEIYNDDIGLQSTSPHKNFTKQQTYSELPNLSKSTTLIKTNKSKEIQKLRSKRKS